MKNITFKIVALHFSYSSFSQVQNKKEEVLKLIELNKWEIDSFSKMDYFKIILRLSYRKL